MATKKIENAIKRDEKIKEEKIRVKIPIDTLNPKDKEIIIGVNERYAKVIRGEETEVSLPVYEVLKNAGLV